MSSTLCLESLGLQKEKSEKVALLANCATDSEFQKYLTTSSFNVACVPQVLKSPKFFTHLLMQLLL